MTRRILTTLTLLALTVALSAGLLHAQGSTEAEPSPYRIDLYSGWNLISFPGDPVDGTLENVVGDAQVDRSWAIRATSGAPPYARPTVGGVPPTGSQRCRGAGAIGCTRLPTIPSKRRSHLMRPGHHRRGVDGIWQESGTKSSAHLERRSTRTTTSMTPGGELPTDSSRARTCGRNSFPIPMERWRQAQPIGCGFPVPAPALQFRGRTRVQPMGSIQRPTNGTRRSIGGLPLESAQATGCRL